MPTSPWMRLSSTCISWRSLRSSAPSGSSSSSTLGRLTIARASATRWRWPPESWAGLRLLVASGGARARAPRRRGGGARLLDLGDLEPVLDVLADRHVREQRVVLEDRVDVARVGRERADVGAAQLDRALVGDREARDQPQRRRLAGAGRAEQREELALGDVEIDAVHGREVAVALGQPAQGDVGQGCPIHVHVEPIGAIFAPIGQTGRDTWPPWSDCSTPQRKSLPPSRSTARWPRACARGGWRSSSARSTCSARAPRCGPRWSPASRTRWCSTGRRGPARRRSRGSPPSTPAPRSRSCRRSTRGGPRCAR